MLVDVEDLDDVGVLELGDGLGLGQEPGGGLGAGVLAGQDHLQGDGAVEPDLAGLVDHAHAAAAELAQDLVAGERGVGTPWGGRRSVAIRRGHDKVGRRDVASKIRHGPPGFGHGLITRERGRSPVSPEITRDGRVTGIDRIVSGFAVVGSRHGRPIGPRFVVHGSVVSLPSQVRRNQLDLK